MTLSSRPYIYQVIYKSPLSIRKLDYPREHVTLIPADSTITLIDKDGTLTFDTGYPSRFSPWFANSSLISHLSLNSSHVTHILWTNQSGLAREKLCLEELENLLLELTLFLRLHHVPLDLIFLCPHLPSDRCFCRKPNHQSIQSLLNTSDIISASMYGDSLADHQAAENLGIPRSRIHKILNTEFCSTFT